MTKEEHERLSNIITDLQYFAITCKPKERPAPPFLVITKQTTQAEIALHKRRCEEYQKSLQKEVDTTSEKKVNSIITNKGDTELIKLKYGQGHIRLKQRKRKDGSIYKIYEGRYYDEFGKIKSVYAKTQSECLKLLRQAHPTKKTVKRIKTITLKEWLPEWFNLFKIKKIKPSTRRNYEHQIYSLIIPALGTYRLKDLSADVLQKFFISIDAGNTRSKVLVLLSAALDKAVILKKLESNPCKAVELPKYKKNKKRAFTYAEQCLILEKANEELAQIFFFLCVTGLRIGEFLALRKDDFFFEEHFFKVDKAITEGIKGEPKTETSNRIVYFTDEIFKYFNINLLGKYNYGALQQAFLRLTKKLTLKNVSLHSTRHTFSSICHSLHLNDKTLQALMGHATLAMTQDTYTHLLKKGESPIRNYLEKLCTFICTII